MVETLFLTLNIHIQKNLKIYYSIIKIMQKLSNLLSHSHVYDTYIYLNNDLQESDAMGKKHIQNT